MLAYAPTIRHVRRDWGRGCLFAWLLLCLSICPSLSAQQVANFFGEPGTDPVSGVGFTVSGLPLTSLDFDGAVVPLPPEGNLTCCTRPGAYRIVLGEDFNAGMALDSPLPANRFALFISGLESGNITLSVTGGANASNFDLAVLVSQGDLGYTYDFNAGVLRPATPGETNTRNGIAILYGTSSDLVESITLVSEGLAPEVDYVGVAFGFREGICVDPAIKPCARCDFAVDGVLDCYDWEIFSRAFFRGEPPADFNDDGLINVADFIGFLDCFASSPACMRPTAPPNDECEGAIGLTEFGLYDFYNCSAFTDSDLPEGCSSSTQDSIRGDVWYCWTNPLTVPAEVCVSTLGTTSMDTVMVVYNGCACPPLPEDVIGCNDDARGGLQSLVSFDAQPGRQYMIRIGTHNPATDNANAVLGSGFFRIASTAACPCDFNCFGGVDSQDFFDFLTAFFASDPRADINMRDGVNSQDFFDFLRCFFEPLPEWPSCVG